MPQQQQMTNPDQTFQKRLKSNAASLTGWLQPGRKTGSQRKGFM